MAESKTDPAWCAARKRYGKLAAILRIVDEARGTDEFVVLRALPNFGESLLDGCTVIKRAPGREEPAASTHAPAA